VRVLLLNHTSRVSGAERSLLDIVSGLRATGAAAEVACPEGALARRARGLGVPVHVLTGTDGSLKLHPVHTPRALGEIARAGHELARLVRARRPDVVHANSIRSGLVAAVAARLGAPPPVVHVRDVLPAGALTSLTFRVLSRASAVLVANSAYTAAAVRATAEDAPLRVVHNPVDLARFDPGRYEPRAERSRLGLAEDGPVVAVIAQLTPWKGQDDAVRAVAMVGRREPRIRLLLVGDVVFSSPATRFDNRSYVVGLRRLVDEVGLAGRVRFLGAREDVPAILSALDALLLPSWEEPFGRTVVEGMAMGLPVLATSVGGPAELITDGRDGLLLPPRSPERWAHALDGLLADSAVRAEIGARARSRALRSWSLEAHVAALRALYVEVAATADAAASTRAADARAIT
jgi:glycosyltransferase involved in cell wall biosynthesis